MVELPRRLRLAVLALALGVVPALAFDAFAWPAAARAETAIHFILDRKVDGPTAPILLAIDRGFFKLEGLGVTLDTAPGGPSDAINKITAGNDDMGVSDLNLLIKLRDQGVTPIKAVFAVFDKPAYAIIARKNRGIVAPRDLVGKTLAAPVGDPTAAVWPVFAKVNGVDAAKVILEPVSLPVREPMLAAGEVDAITGYSFMSYVDLEARGVPPDDLAVLLMADHGLALYGETIVVAPSFAQAHPDAVRGFLHGYVRGLKDALRDPLRAVTAVLRRNDAASKDVELERLRMAFRDNIVTPAVKANGVGAVDPARFATAIDQMALAYAFRAKDKAAEVFDPSLLPPPAERSLIGLALR